jgi:adenylate cyclase
MGFKDFLEEIDNEVESIISSDFSVEITDTEYVPNVDDSGITYDNIDNKIKKCKRLESCVLYIDIRKSTDLSVSHKPITLTRLYSAFVRSMVKAAQYYNGYVRNIVGDRVMVVFDRENCFLNAVNTAILFNSLSKYIINKHFKNNDIKCGIGIDYGKMLVVKTGTVKKGKENQFYKSLVWLGRPANVASKLTDAANKTSTKYRDGVSVGLHYPYINEWSWIDMDITEFIENLEITYTPILKYKNSYFKTLIKSQLHNTNITQPILITKDVFDGLKKEAPNEQSLKEGWWRKQNISVSGYSGDVFGADIIFTVINEV